jgi:fructoselysine-6-P-deglycase FrlB-like protein
MTLSTEPISTEINSQAATWGRAGEIAIAHRDELPHGGEHVAFVGCGTSWFMAQAAASRREELGLGVSDAWCPSDPHFGRPYDRAVIFCRSGTTTEIVATITKLESSGVPTTVLTAVPGSPVTRVATHTILLDFADEESEVQTRFATTALTVLRAHFGEDVATLQRDCRTALAMELPSDLRNRPHVVSLGMGFAAALASEAALKASEAAKAWSVGHPSLEYRHGPIATAGAQTVVYALGEQPPGLVDEIRERGATVVEANIDPQAMLVVAQRAAVALAALQGVNASHPEGVQRSVMF